MSGGKEGRAVQGARRRAEDVNHARATMRRAPGGVRLPWAATFVVLLLLSLCFALSGRNGHELVPDSVLLERGAIAHATADAIRKGLDETSVDLVVLSERLLATPEPSWSQLLRSFTASHTRYLCVYLLGPDRRATRVTGHARPHTDLLPEPLPVQAGLIRPRVVGNQPVLLAYAPLRAVPGGAQLVVGRYDLTRVQPALQQLLPGDAYLVDETGHLIGATRGFRSNDLLPAARLIRALRRTSVAASGAVLDGSSITSFAAVRGNSPAGRLGLAVVADLPRSALALPAYQARRQAVLLSVLTALVSGLSMLWMYVLVTAPTRRLTKQAVSIAAGDASVPSHVRRYDEIGLTTRALARCRELLAARGQD